MWRESAKHIPQGYLLSPLLFRLALEVSAGEVRQQKVIKGMQTGKEEVKASLFADVIHLKDYRKLCQLTNLLSKRVGYKINTQKSVASLYTQNIHTEEKKVKYLGINLICACMCVCTHVPFLLNGGQ